MKYKIKEKKRTNSKTWHANTDGKSSSRSPTHFLSLVSFYYTQESNTRGNSFILCLRNAIDEEYVTKERIFSCISLLQVREGDKWQEVSVWVSEWLLSFQSMINYSLHDFNHIMTSKGIKLKNKLKIICIELLIHKLWCIFISQTRENGRYT